MNRATILAVISVAALAATVAACGSGAAPVSHADHLACRTVYREQELYNAGGGLPVFAPDAGAEAIGASAIGTTQPLNRDMNAAVNRLLLNGVDTANLAPLERDCAALGITQANSEQTGASS